MDSLWLIHIFLGIEFLFGNSLTPASGLPLPLDYVGHGTQYRFQYFVRDESGDYKTQEEAGEGGNARGSYAVEEPDGDLRIVQYNTDLEGGFKAHIKVDHAGKSSSALQEIDIPAEEMKSLIDKNRKKAAMAEDPVPDHERLSKSYVLGPPKKMSEIVMEQAAAIREIIAKEIEAEKKREAEEQKSKTDKDIKKSVDNEEKEEEAETTLAPIENERTGQEINIDSEEKAGKISPENSETDSKVDKNDEKSQSPVVRVALSPRKLEEGENPIENDAKRPKPEGSLGEEGAAGAPVTNISFKNRIMFYKPAEENDEKEKDPAGENLPGVAADRDLESVPKDEIILYSPHQEDGKTQGDRKSKYITVPYEILRPYLTQVDN